MRTDAAPFAAANTRAYKEPRFVVQIEYVSVSLYLSSHADIASVPESHIPGCLMEPSITSQKLNPDQGRAEIGSASFSVADLDQHFTDTIRGLHAAGEGLRDRTCRFYLGYKGLDFADFQLVGTQIVKEARYDKGAYRISCNDVQRSARKDIFDLAQTTLAQTVEAADATIFVSSTAGFERCKHGTSYSDAASSTVGYLKIKDEVIRYTASSTTSFTGCTRGALGTQAARYVVDGATPTNRREKVAEYVYLELPGPKLAYALLTGVLYGDSANLPAKWHLGIPTSFVRLADFTDIGDDVWDTASDANGVILRFEGIVKGDGKAFIELEVLRLLAMFMPVYASGELGLKRMTRVLSDASGVLTLDESNSVSVGELEHDMEALHNAFSISWNWNGKDFTRTTTYLDATSATKHGLAPTLELKFKGLYGGRHTDGLVFKTLDCVRDRYSAPPVRMRIEVFHSLNRIEVGDVLRAVYRNVRDYTQAAESIDRAFEVQGISVDHYKGGVTLDLFGSTSRASIESPTGSTTALPDAYYTALGTNLAGVMTIAGGVVSGGPYTLAGGTDIRAAGSTWYYNGDLTIPAGVTVNITGNVQLRIKGYLTINGTISGVGGGWAGVADSGDTTIVHGNPGWVGNARGLDGIQRINFDSDKLKIKTNPCQLTQGKHASFPFMQLEVSGNTLKGLPTDIRGTGGGPGGKIVHEGTGSFYASGGTGAAGGAGLCTVSRGFGIGANASINLSGAAATAASAYTYNDNSGKHADLFPGTGGAGGPGGFLLLIDGSLLSVPDLAGRFVSRSGIVTLPAFRTALLDGEPAKFKYKDAPLAGYLEEPSVISDLDLSFSASRIQYIPAPETAVADTTVLAPVTSLKAVPSTSGYVVSFTAPAGAPDGTIFEVWEHTANTPFASATLVRHGAANGFFVDRPNTTTVYIWVRARYVDAAGKAVTSATAPSGNGLAIAAAAVSGTYATAAPTSVSASAANATVTTAAVTATLVGTTGTTFAWTRVSGSASISANSAAAATTTFTATSVAVGATLSAVMRCTINSTYTIDVPVDCTNSTSSLTVAASPTSVSKAGGTASLTTASVTATASGGAGGTTYAWTKQSGDSITADSSSAATTTFSATGLATGETRTATFRCTATDSAAATATVDVSVTITRSSVTVTVSPSPLTKSGYAGSQTTGSATASTSGGTAPYAYAWVRQSGVAIACNSPSSATTTFTMTGMFGSTTYTAVFRVTATDANGLTATADLTVSITCLEHIA